VYDVVLGCVHHVLVKSTCTVMSSLLEQKGKAVLLGMEVLSGLAQCDLQVCRSSWQICRACKRHPWDQPPPLLRLRVCRCHFRVPQCIALHDATAAFPSQICIAALWVSRQNYVPPYIVSAIHVRSDSTFQLRVVEAAADHTPIMPVQ
jgi:hypothetical protein